MYLFSVTSPTTGDGGQVEKIQTGLVTQPKRMSLGQGMEGAMADSLAKDLTGLLFAFVLKSAFWVRN